MASKRAQDRANRAMVRQLFRRQETDEKKAESAAFHEKARQDEAQSQAAAREARVKFGIEEQHKEAQRQAHYSRRLQQFLRRPKDQPPRIDGPAEPPEAESVREKPPSHVDGDELPAPALRILTALQSSPKGLSRSGLRRRVFNDNVPAAQVGEWLNCLLARGLVSLDLVPTPGRYAEVWTARRRRRR
jgi:hypothetical protein